MRRSVRLIMFLVAALGFGAIYLLALANLPPFGDYAGPYGDVINQQALPQRHTPQSVAAVTFDYRGFDTLGEEFMLFAAVAGVLLLTRQQRTEREIPPKDRASDRRIPHSNEALQTVASFLFPFTVLLGLYIVFHGHLTPGGGFQGGVLLASAFLFIYLGSEHRVFHQFIPEQTVEGLEGAGAGTYVIVGLLGLLAGGVYLQNVLPLGQANQLLSAGILPVLNLAVGLEVGCGFLLLLEAFLHQALSLRRRKEP